MSNEPQHTPGPWTWREAVGAGLQISATLPVGFNFSGPARLADGSTSFLIWTLRQSQVVQIADERWAKFTTGSWDEMPRANARLIAAAPEMAEKIVKLEADKAELLVALEELIEVADLRGDSDLPHPADDRKLWTARMQTAWDDARAAIAKAQGKESGA